MKMTKWILSALLCAALTGPIQPAIASDSGVFIVDANGAGANVGALQVLVDGAFGTVSGMNVPAADVACRELGAANASAGLA